MIPTLKSASATLEPLHPSQAEELHGAINDPDVWQYLPQAEPCTVDDVQDWITTRLSKPFRPPEWPWMIRDADGVAAGSTSFLDMDLHHGRVEIGYTLLGTAWWRTGLNRAVKAMLLHYAFEEMGLRKVWLKTDSRNVRSQKAMEGIGAMREGVLRSHDVVRDGYVRDTVVYAILATEWQDNPLRKLV